MLLEVLGVFVGLFFFGVMATLGVQGIITDIRKIHQLNADTKRIHMSYCKQPPCRTPEYHR